MCESRESLTVRNASGAGRSREVTILSMEVTENTIGRLPVKQTRAFHDFSNNTLT